MTLLSADSTAEFNPVQTVSLRKFPSFQVFKIEVLMNGRQHTVEKRYSEFHTLHKMVRKSSRFHSRNFGLLKFSIFSQLVCCSV